MQTKKEIPSDIIVKLFLIISVLFGLFLSSCSSQFYLSTLNNDPIYSYDVVIPISKDTKVDTINSFSELKWRLRTDFNFRWEFAQYAMNQPLSWYYNNPRLDGIWRPYNRFDVYFHSNWFWTDWAWNYPYNYNRWGWNNWNYTYHYYGWHNWYRPYRPWNNWYNGPWHSPGYNVIWNSSRQNNVAYINGRRGSRSIENTIISNRINNANDRPNNNNVIDNIVNIYRNNGNSVRVYNNPNNFNNDQIIKPNNRTNWQTQSNNNGGRSWGREVIPSKPTSTWQSSSNQPRQIYRGSGSSSIQQSGGRSSSSGQRSRGAGGTRH